MANNSDEADDNLNDSFVDEPSGESEGEYEAENPQTSQISSLILKLKRSGVVKNSPKKLRCYTCEIDFDDNVEFHEHLVEHVSLPSIVLQRLDEDDEFNEFEEEYWSSDGEKSSDVVLKPIPVANLTKIGGVTIKSTKTDQKVPDSIMSLKSIGNIMIKKLPNVKSSKEDKEEEADEEAEAASKEMKKMESSGTLKLTIKQSDRTFQVVNGANEVKSENTTERKPDEPQSEAEKDESNVCDNKIGILESIINMPIKTEPQDVNEQKNDQPTEGVQVKTECNSRPQSPATDPSTNQINVKPFASERKPPNESNIVIPKPMIIPKVEVADSDNVIEINCDSDKEDDEIIFVSSEEPTVDKKPPIGIEKVTKNESNEPPPKLANSSEKQHNFNWNAPGKVNATLESLLADKNNDRLLENLLRKDGFSDLGSSEYISLDKLGPQHTCDVCDVRYTSVEMLENHKKTTGHSNQLVSSARSQIDSSSSSLVLPSYQQPDFLMNSLLPVKQLAETVSKISTVSQSSSTPFTHQQNIMVNIQSFPGSMNQPMGMQSTHPQSYGNNFGSMSHMGGNYPPDYRSSAQNPPMPPQYASQYHMGSQSGYSGGYPQYPSSQSMMGQSLSVPMNPPYQPYLSQYPPQPYPQTSTSQSLSLTQAIPTSQQQQPPTSTPAPPSIIPLPYNSDPTQSSEGSKSASSGIKIQSIQTINGPVKGSPTGPRMSGPRMAKLGNPRMPIRGPRPGGVVGSTVRPLVKQGIPVNSLRGTIRPGIRPGMKRPAPTNGAITSPSKKRMDMNDSEDCQVMSMQHQRDGLPIIQSMQGSKEKNPVGVQLSRQLTVTKTKVRPPTPPATKDANSVANMLASRGIKITAKSKTPPPSVNIPNFGSGISITSTRTTSEEDYEVACAVCSKNFPSYKALSLHMAQTHPPQKNFKCPSCPISYTTSIQLEEHRQHFHSNSSSEMGLPVVDLSQHATLRKLNSIGITNFIPLANKDQGSSCFAVPIVSIQSAMSGSSNTLSALSANGILTLGPIKPLPKN